MSGRKHGWRHRVAQRRINADDPALPKSWEGEDLCRQEAEDEWEPFELYDSYRDSWCEQYLGFTVEHDGGLSHVVEPDGFSLCYVYMSKEMPALASTDEADRWMREHPLDWSQVTCMACVTERARCVANIWNWRWQP